VAAAATPREAPSSRVVAARAPAPVPAAVASSRPDPLAEETRLFRGAQVALRAGDARGALALLDAYAARFPRGMLREESEAARVHALCELGRRREARAVAARLLRESPRSPVVETVRGSCAEGPED
jgi:hypothetical protein